MIGRQAFPFLEMALGDMFVFSGVDGVDVFLLMELSHSSKMARFIADRTISYEVLSRNFIDS